MISFDSLELPSIHLGNLYKLNPIPWDYPLSSIIKLVSLSPSYILALDWYCNLHVIRYSNNSPPPTTQHANRSATSSSRSHSTEVQIHYPPIAITGHPHIHFSIQYLHLRQKYSPKRPLEEDDDLNFFSQLDYNTSHYINICLLEPGKVLFKASRNDPAYFIDFTVPNCNIFSIEDLMEASKIIKVSNEIIIFQDSKSHFIILYALKTKKRKALEFKCKEEIVSLGLFNDKKLCVALFQNSLEVINLGTNKILEKVVFVGIQNPQVATHELSDIFVLGYFLCKADNKEISLEVYSVVPQKEGSENIERHSPIARNEPVHVAAHTNTTLFSLEWLDAEHLLLFCKWEVIFYKVKREGIIKLSTVKVPFDFGYENFNNTFTPNSWCFAVLNPHYFAILTADERWGSLQMYLDVCKVIFEVRNNQLESFMESIINIRDNRNPRNVQIQGINHPKNELVKMEPTRLLGSKSDYIRLMCCWQEEVVFALTYKHNLLKVDLKRGKKIEKIANISGLLLGTSSLLKMRCVRKDVLVLVFEDSFDKNGLIVLDLKDIQILFNSFIMEGRNVIQNMKNIVVMDDVGRIIIKYNTRGEENVNNSIVGEVEFWATGMNNIKELFRIPMDKESECFVNLGDNYFVADDVNNLTSISIYGLETKGIVRERDFEGIDKDDTEEENSERETGYCFVDNINRVNNELMALYYYEPGMICVYNWKKDVIVARCSTDVESILRVVGNRLIFMKDEEFRARDQTVEGIICEVNLKPALRHEGEKPVNLDWHEWSEYGLVVKEECFWGVNNGRKIATVERKNFPSAISLIHEVNLKLELLRVLNKEVKKNYNYYVVKYVFNMINAPKEE